jgi:hypothetical protein
MTNDSIDKPTGDEQAVPDPGALFERIAAFLEEIRPRLDELFLDPGFEVMLAALKEQARARRRLSGRHDGQPVPGRHDTGLRRKATRTGRQRGCLVYIAAEELLLAGIDPYADPPHYRVYPKRGLKRAAISFWAEP